MPDALKVLIAGEDEDVYGLLNIILEKEPSITVVGHAKSGEELAELLLSLSPNVAMLDLDAPGMGMLAAVRDAKQKGSQTGFVGLVGDAGVDHDLLGEVDALFYKNSPMARLPTTVYDVGSMFRQAVTGEGTENNPEARQKAEELQLASLRLEEAKRIIEGAFQTLAELGLSLPQPGDGAEATLARNPALIESNDVPPGTHPTALFEPPRSGPADTCAGDEFGAVEEMHETVEPEQGDAESEKREEDPERRSLNHDALVEAADHEPLKGTPAGKRAVASPSLVRDLYLNLLDELPAPVWRSGPDGKYSYFNKSWLAFTGRTIEQEIGDGWTEGVHSDDLDRRVKTFQDAFEAREPFEMEYRFRRHDGEYRWIIDIGRPFHDLAGHFAGYIGLCHDITERRRTEQHLVYLATHDTLTGLPNRRTLEEALRRVLARARRGYASTLLFLDVDNFKLINDSLGHVAGDRALVTLTQLLQNQLRTEDLLARLGGDEFVALLEGTSVEEAQVVAERARRAVEEFRFIFDGQVFNLSLSVGLVAIDGQQAPVALLSQADAAMYKAKEQGRNRVMLYRPEEDSLVLLSESNQLVVQLKNAIGKGLFVLHYQPVVRLSDGQIDHYEALVRLRGEAGNIVFPKEFIPAAERFGLMPQLTRWIVQESIRTLRENSDIRLSANLSGLDLTDETLPEFIEARLRGYKVEPKRLGFEIAEIAIRNNLVTAERWIGRLKGMGCRFALDNFGAGFVSFAHLRDLPIDQFKIDGSFIRALDTDPSQRTVVQAVQALARMQGKETVAEWVESEEIAHIIKDIGVPFGQGYYLGKTKTALNA